MEPLLSPSTASHRHIVSFIRKATRKALVIPITSRSELKQIVLNTIIAVAKRFQMHPQNFHADKAKENTSENNHLYRRASKPSNSWRSTSSTSLRIKPKLAPHKAPVRHLYYIDASIIMVLRRDNNSAITVLMSDFHPSCPALDWSVNLASAFRTRNYSPIPSNISPSTLPSSSHSQAQ